MVVDPLEPISIFSSQTNILPNIKWQFLLFGTALKDYYTRSNYSKFSFTFFIIRIYIATSSSLYYISSLSEEFRGKNNEFEIFPYSTLLSIITPVIFTRTAFLAVIMVFLLIFIYSMCYCFIHVDQIPKFFVFINPDLHSMLFPMTMGTVSYVIYIIFSSHFDNISFYVLCAVLFVLFTPYLIGYFALTFLLQTTLLKPNSYIGRFFCFFQSYVIVFNMFILFNTYNLTRYRDIVRYMALSLNVTLCIIYIFLTWRKLPFTSYIANELTIAETATAGVVYFLTFFVTKESIFGRYVINWIGPILPLIFLLFLNVSRYVCEKRSHKYIRYLENFTPGSVVAYDYLTDILGSLKSEDDFYLLTIIGLQNSFYVTSTEEYAGFLIEKFPNKEWVIKYIIFMYSSVWGMTDDTYKIFLHYLSIDSFSLSTQMLFFESIYFYIQTSHNKSPIIMKEINTLTEIIMQFAIVSKQLWSHKPDVPEVLYDDISIVHEALLSCKHQIKKMMFLFPFCPDVYFFKSIFQADFKKNFQKASIPYEKGLIIFNNRQNYVTHELNRCIKPYINIPPRVDIDMNTHINQNVFTFLSISDHSQELSITRHASIKAENSFLEMFSKTYSSERNQLLTPTPIIKKWFDTARVCLFLFSFLLIGLAIYLMILFKKTVKISNNFIIVFNFTNNLQAFVEDVHKLHFEYMIEKDIREDSFSNFVISHMQKSFDSYVNFSNSLIRIGQRNGLIQKDIYTFMKVMHSVITNKENDLLLDSETVINIKNSILNDVLTISKELIKFYKVEIIGKYQTIMNTIKVITTFIVLLMIINTVALHLLNNKLKEVLFTVFSTIQYHVRKVVEKQFNFFLKARDPSLAPPKRSSLSVPIFWNILCCFTILVCFLLFNILLHVFVRRANYDFVFDKVLNLSISYNGFKEHAKREHRICPNYENCSHNSTICIDSYFNYYTPVPMNSLVTQFSESNTTKIILVLLLIFAFYFYYKFIKTIQRMLKIYDECNYLLFSIPMNIGRSNYIFNMIITGRTMSDNKVKQYAEELKTPHIDFDNFGTVKFNEEGNYTESAGNVEGIFGIIPFNYVQLRQKMLDDKISEKAINKMFEEKSSHKEVFGYGEREYSASFIEDDTILFRDNTGNKYTIRPDIFDLLASINPRKDIVAPEDACVFSFTDMTQDNEVKISDFVEKHFTDLILIDSNESQLVYITDMNSDQDIKINDVRRYIEVAKGELINKGRCVITYGGKVSSRANKKQIEKKKMFGTSINDSFIISLLADELGIYAQTELLDIVGIEYSKDDVIEFNPTDGTEGRVVRMVHFH